MFGRRIYGSPDAFKILLGHQVRGCRAAHAEPAGVRELVCHCDNARQRRPVADVRCRLMRPAWQLQQRSRWTMPWLSVPAGLSLASELTTFHEAKT